VSRLPYFGALLGLKFRISSLVDSAKTALQTVAAGQAAENLLDFDDEPAQDGPTGLAATQVLQQPAAKNILSGTSANPLDDLVSIFGNTSLSPSAPVPSAAPVTDPFGALGGVPSPTAAPSTTSNQQEDLLGLF
jgi:AP-1 complex subunit beta-1